MPPEAPFRLINRRYRLEALLGEGAMGSVHRAVDLFRDGRTVALKLLAAERSREEVRDRLRSEFHALTRLHHPNLVRVLDLAVDRQTGRWFLTLEYVDGRPLTDWNPPDGRALLDLFVPLLLALDYIHLRGFVHADVKPENILVSEVGAEPRLADFGLAGVLGRPGAMRGTLPYTAPEVLKGDPPGPASDFYSLGATLYRTIARHGPFDAPTPEAVIAGHLTGDLVFDAVAFRSAPPGLTVLLRRLLAKDPSARPRSGAEVVEAINDLAGTTYALGSSRDHTAIIGLPVFTGRESELGTLDVRLREIVEARHGGAVVVTGPAGIGRSRLLEEIRVRAQMEGITVASGQCRAEEHDAFRPAIDALRDLVPLSPAAHPPALARLLGELPAPPDGGGVDLLAVMEAAAGLVRMAADQVPVLLIFEDLHLAGPDLLEFLTHLVRGLRTAPALLLAAGRDGPPGAPFADFAQSILAETHVSSITLGPLAPAETARMVASALGVENVDAEIVARLDSLTAGNPYLLLETVRASLDAGVLLRGPDGGWRLDPEESARQRLPSDLGERALLRIRKAPQEEIAVLEALSVAALPLDAHSVAQLIAQEPRVVARALARMVEEDILSRTDDRGSTPVYAFAHAFLRDALYHRMGRTDAVRRARLHERLARALLLRRSGVSGEPAALIAHHLAEAGELNEASDYWLSAAAHQQERLAFDSARRYLSRAVESLQATGETGARLARALERLGDIERLANRPREAQAAYDRALATAGADATTDTDEGRLLCKQALSQVYQGNTDAGLDLARRAAAASGRAQDQGGVARAENAAGIAFARRGEHARAAEHYARALAIRRELDDRSGVAGCLLNLGMVRSFERRTEEARELLHEAEAIYRALGDTDSLAMVLNNQGLLAADDGRLDEACRLLREADRAYETSGSLRKRAQCLVVLARAELNTGAFDRAAEHGSLAADLYRRLGMPAGVAEGCEVLGEACRESGRIEAALEAHERGFATADRANDPIQRAFSLLSLAFDQLSAGNTAAAAEALDRAAAQAGATANNRLRMRLARGRALLALAEGRAEAALRDASALLADAAPGLDASARLDTELIRVRALIELSRFADALSALDAVLPGEDVPKAPFRKWEILRLRAQALSGAGGQQEAETARQAAADVLAGLAAGLSPEFRAALEGSPAAVRLRVETGGSEHARIAPGRVLDAMYAVIDSLTSLDGGDDAIPDRLMDLALELLRADRGLILLFPEDGGAPRVATSRNLEAQTVADAISYSSRVVEEGRLGRALVVTDAISDSRLKEFKSVSLLGIRSVICVPMRGRDRVIGTVYVDSRSRAIGFDQDDLRFLEAFAEHAAAWIENARMMRALERENLILRREALERHSFGNIVGRSEPMQRMFETLRAVTGSSLPVLVCGESGTGKELVARALHYNGPRRERPFLSENCAAFPEPLLESQLFGHARGAFTGATSEHRGLFQEADGGTLFLDEIGEMSSALQARLTRVLETGEIRPVGGSNTFHVDVRVIAATHRDLDAMVADGRFRRDLLFRLNVIVVDLPPLRERREDIPLLVSHFLAEMAREAETEVPGIEDGALDLLAAQNWPGNVRQLRNDVGRLLLFREGELITAAAVRDICLSGLPGAPLYEEDGDRIIPLQELERRHVLRALEEANGDRTRAAILLKVGRATVFRKIKDYHLDA